MRWRRRPITYEILLHATMQCAVTMRSTLCRLSAAARNAGPSPHPALERRLCGLESSASPGPFPVRQKQGSLGVPLHRLAMACKRGCAWTPPHRSWFLVSAEWHRFHWTESWPPTVAPQGSKALEVDFSTLQGPRVVSLGLADLNLFFRKYRF